MEGYSEVQGGGKKGRRRGPDRTGSAGGPRGRKGGVSDLVAMGLPVHRVSRPGGAEGHD